MINNIMVLVFLGLFSAYAHALSFNEAVQHVLKSEGGYSNDENDATGEVRYGITGTTARRAGYKGSMRDLPLSTAREIYKKLYWDKLPKDISSKAKFVAFDAAVNQGNSYAKKLVRETGGDVEKMINHRKNRYYRTARNSPHLRKFLKGWINRLNSVSRFVGSKNIIINASATTYKKKQKKTQAEKKKVAVTKSSKHDVQFSNI